MKYAGMPFGMCVLMKELGLYDLAPALCRLDYTMSEAGGVTNFVRQWSIWAAGWIIPAEPATTADARSTIWTSRM